MPGTGQVVAMHEHGRTGVLMSWPSREWSMCAWVLTMASRWRRWRPSRSRMRVTSSRDR